MCSMKGIDLFSGAGGLTLGLKKAGVETVCAVEKKKDATETFQRHTPEADIRCGDIRSMDFKEFRGKIELVYGGPPCQPFSTGGLRKGAADNRDMIPEFLRAVLAIQPRVVLMENVPGLAVKSRVGYLKSVLGAFWEMGYRPNCSVMFAAHYGVPQKRRRLFIVAIRDRSFWFPRTSHGPYADKSVIPSSTILSHEPIGEPPDCPVVYAKYPDLRKSPYAGHIYNGGGRPIDLTQPCYTILASAGGYKTHWIDTEGIVPKYHAHLVAGGNPWEGEVPGARRITVEESALIQTFPEDLVFAGSRSSQYTQIGDAVPPVLAEALGRTMVRQANGPDEVDTSTHIPPDQQTPLFVSIHDDPA